MYAGVPDARRPTRRSSTHLTPAQFRAATDPIARDRPVCLRYSNEYAAMVATGTWKAKKHKDMATAAKRAWATLRKMKPGGQVWLHHTKPHGTATELAARGKQGETVYAATYD